ncbi:efflux RND transporter periplasmic adaptor subunit [Paraglaciecola sp. L1A13]|uniref:efflux RND transporter periplasmic adaptor subunit n=1 Tax=Paraglaciecola sp. L1A13 TaxID=2686359 RepID=UPI00131B7880|nr:efflux RND transporter periplasmic adaptor subunit [Paraglaciecola sp. L1A13]
MNITDTSSQDTELEKSSSKKYLWIVLLIALILTGLFIIFQDSFARWSSADTSLSMQNVRIASVTEKDFVRDLSVQGRVVAAVSPRLYSPAQGTITFLVDAGDKVVKGQVLAHIDSPELTNQLKQEESNLQRNKLELDRQRIQGKKLALEKQKAADLSQIATIAAEREKRRADSAYTTHAISEIDFEKAQDDLKNAQLVYKHAVLDANLDKESLDFELKTQQLMIERQALQVAETKRQVDQLQLRSPVNGIVGNLAVQQKNQVSKNQPILSVVDLSEFELEVDIPESYADDLAIGMDAQVSLNGQQYPAVLVTISPEIENNQVTGRVRFAKQDDQGNTFVQPKGLRQNQRLSTRILMENKRAVLTLARGQFLQSDNGRFAYVVKNDMAIRQPITIGARSLSEVEILAGLENGDQVIISSTDSLKGAETVLLAR